MTQRARIGIPKWKILSYPENLMYDIMVEDLSEDNPEHLLTEKQRAALYEAISTLSFEEQQVIEKRYQDYKTYRVIGEELGVDGGKSRSICSKALRKLYHPDFRTRYREQ